MISTPFRRPRRPEVAFRISLGRPPADGCAFTSDITPAYPSTCLLDKHELTTMTWSVSGSSWLSCQLRRSSTDRGPSSSPGWRQKTACAFKSPPLRHRPVPAKATSWTNADSIRVRCGYAGPVHTPQSRPQAPGHRDQFDPSQGRCESSEASGHPGGRRSRREHSDCSRHQSKRDRSASHQERCDSQPQAGYVEASFRIVDQRSAVRAGLRVSSLDCSSSHIAEPSPLAAVLQVLPAHVN